MILAISSQEQYLSQVLTLNCFFFVIVESIIVNGLDPAFSLSLLESDNRCGNDQIVFFPFRSKNKNLDDVAPNLKLLYNCRRLHVALNPLNNTSCDT